MPAGHYHLLVVSDLNRDGRYDETEEIGVRWLKMDEKELPGRVLGGLDLDLKASFRPPVIASFNLEVNKPDKLTESLFYPRGSIRSLDDEIFSPRMATLGMYEPAAFIEEAPMMF